MIPLPIRDLNPTSRRPVVMPALVVINIVVWILELKQGYLVLPGGEHLLTATFDYGLIPRWLLSGISEGTLKIPLSGGLFGAPNTIQLTLHQEVPQPWPVLTSMFMHGSWMHLIGNMWFLWIFGDNVEDAMGRFRFLIFYLICGVAAALAQVFSAPMSVVPMVGASGAIAGVLGGYLVLYPRARVQCLWILIIFITTIQLPAWLLLGLWFLGQLAIPSETGVAAMAHVGGFVAGVALVKLFSRRRQTWYAPRA